MNTNHLTTKLAQVKGRTYLFEGNNCATLKSLDIYNTLGTYIAVILLLFLCSVILEWFPFNTVQTDENGVCYLLVIPLNELKVSLQCPSVFTVTESHFPVIVQLCIINLNTDFDSTQHVRVMPHNTNDAHFNKLGVQQTSH